MIGSIHQMTYASKICYSTWETLLFSHDMAHKYRDVEGNIVECGVAAGAQVIAMKSGDPEAMIFAYDSYEGIPKPSNRDNQYPGIRMLSKSEQESLPNPGAQTLETTGATSVPLDDFWNHIVQSGVKKIGVIPVKGWFEETVPQYDKGPIKILRLDGDLYNSTFVCLQYLFPHVIKGGLVIIDDIELPGCRDACFEYFEFIDYIPNYQQVSNIAFFVK